MTNPFDNVNGTFFVLVNDEGQHSLWPDFAAMPAGWQSVFGPSSRDECTSYVEDHWVDMRPQSLVDAVSRGET